MKIVTENHGVTLREAPFKRDMQLADKKREFIAQMLEAMRTFQQEKRVPTAALAEATGINARVIGRRLNEPEIR